jgi:hypothetical protein
VDAASSGHRDPECIVTGMIEHLEELDRGRVFRSASGSLLARSISRQARFSGVATLPSFSISGPDCSPLLVEDFADNVTN